MPKYKCLCKDDSCASLLKFIRDQAPEGQKYDAHFHKCTEKRLNDWKKVHPDASVNKRLARWHFDGLSVRSDGAVCRTLPSPVKLTAEKVAAVKGNISLWLRDVSDKTHGRNTRCFCGLRWCAKAIEAKKAAGQAANFFRVPLQAEKRRIVLDGLVGMGVEVDRELYTMDSVRLKSKNLFLHEHHFNNVDGKRNLRSKAAVEESPSALTATNKRKRRPDADPTEVEAKRLLKQFKRTTTTASKVTWMKEKVVLPQKKAKDHAKMLKKKIEQLEKEKKEMEVEARSLERLVDDIKKRGTVLRYEHLRSWRPKRIKMFTGISNGFDSVEALWDVLNTDGMTASVKQYRAENNKSVPHPVNGSTPIKVGAEKHQVNRGKPGKKDQWFLTLFFLRTGASLSLTSELFGVDRATGGRYFTTWIRYMKIVLRQLFFFPTQDMLKKDYPKTFSEKFPYEFIAQVWDGTEIPIQCADNNIARWITWSQYKHRYTAKFLLSLSAGGTVIWTSDAYGGRISDDDLVRVSGILDTLNELDAILADKGFRSAADLAEKGATYVTPSKKFNGVSFNNDDVTETEVVANLRIHVERAMRRVKEFRALSTGAFPIHLVDLMGDAFYVVCMLGNLQEPLCDNLHSR